MAGLQERQAVLPDAAQREMARAQCRRQAVAPQAAALRRARQGRVAPTGGGREVL